jgi:aminoglycoside phosphotransferase (APT) family kinase protein
VDRSPYALAALASTLPGIEPVGVQQVPNAPENEFDVAFVQDRTDRRWVVRSPRTPAAAARMEAAITLLGLLSRRVTFSVPAPRGLVELKEGGRAAVYPYLPGRNVDFARIPAGRGVAVEIGRTLAALHNVDPALYDEAGAPVYDADAVRTRRLGDLDRAAETGRVPTTLLSRWERALEDVTLWRYAPTPIHGDLTGDEVLVSFDDPEDVTSAKVRGLTGWEDARVGDPADDFASLVAECTPEALESVMEAYSHARIERPDANLLVRARLASEMALLAELQRAITAGWDEAVEAHSAALRRLDDEVNALADAENDYKRTSLDPVKPRSRQTPPPLDYAEDESEEELPGLDDEEPPAPAGTKGDATEVIDLRDPDAGGDEPGEGAGQESTPASEPAPDGAAAADGETAESTGAGDATGASGPTDAADAADAVDATGGDVRPHSPAPDTDDPDEPDELDPMYR